MNNQPSTTRKSRLAKVYKSKYRYPAIFITSTFIWYIITFLASGHFRLMMFGLSAFLGLCVTALIGIEDKYPGTVSHRYRSR